MGYIFESEIELIMNAVRARTIGEAESIRLRDILNADLHPALKAYFRARIWQLLQQERQTEVRSKRLPYALPEVMRLQDQIDILLVYNYTFGQHDFTLMLDHAVHFQFNFLCRPQWTLLSFIFENQRRRPTSDIRRKLEYCVDYAYYAEIIKRYIDDRGLAELTYEEFGDVLKKIDEEIVARHSSVELALMTRPILRFIDPAREHGDRPLADAKIPINAAIVFFEDKQLNQIKDRLELERDSNGLVEISLRQLATIIERVRTGSESAEVAFEADHPPEEPEPAGQAVAPPGAGLTPEPPKANKGPIKVFSDFDDEVPAVSGEVEAIQKSVGEPVRMELSAGVLVNLQSLFSPSEEKTFIKRVFDRDELLFREALDRLNEMTEWEEASKYLQDMYLMNDVDPFSEAAILFTDKVQRRFLPSEGNESAA